MIRTVIFDMDGTLVDSEPLQAKVMRQCFQEWKVRISDDDANVIAGRTAAFAFDFLFRKYEFPVARDQAALRMAEIYDALLQKGLPSVPGAVEAVQELAGHFKVGLVSGSTRREIFHALGQLGIREHFEVVLGAEDYPRSKPAPDGYLKAVELLKADPMTSLVFEDSEPGIASARTAGLWVVAITSTNHFGHDQSSAHEKIPDLTGVGREWVKNFLSRR